MRRHRFALAGLLVALSLLAAGCLSGTETTATPETVEGTLPAATTPDNDLPAMGLEGDAADGKAIFASAGCGGCHALADAGSTGAVGPNLDDAKPSFELTVTRVTEGLAPMPAFAGQLTDQEIADVSQYVVSSTGG
jgi:mono/diheme cytochrome c family protein